MTRSDTSGPDPTGEAARHVVIVAGDPEARAVAGLDGSQRLELLHARSERELLELAGGRGPSAVVVDLRRSGFDRDRILDALGPDGRGPGAAVIFLSPDTTSTERVTALERGATDFITSDDPREVAARVHAAIRARRPLIDPITGLGARDAFAARVEEEVARSRRSRSALSLLMLSIDNFEDLLELHGRVAGDRVLSSIAETLRATLRTADAPFRFGRAEIAVVLPDTEVATATTVADRARALVRSLRVDAGRVLMSPAGREAPAFTASIGLAELSPREGAAKLITDTETAMQRAREAGGDRTWRADDPRRHGLGLIALTQDLTQREWDVLAHLARRRTEQEIADSLGIRSGTVRSHKARIRRKLHVAPNVRLADFARRHLAELLDQRSEVG